MEKQELRKKILSLLFHGDVAIAKLFPRYTELFAFFQQSNYATRTL